MHPPFPFVYDRAPRNKCVAQKNAGGYRGRFTVAVVVCPEVTVLCSPAAAQRWSGAPIRSDMLSSMSVRVALQSGSGSGRIAVLWEKAFHFPLFAKKNLRPKKTTTAQKNTDAITWTARGRKTKPSRTPGPSTLHISRTSSPGRALLLAPVTSSSSSSGALHHLEG